MSKRLFIFCLCLTLYLHSAIAQDDVAVPDMRDMNLPQAAATLNTMGLNLGEVTAVLSTGETRNTIVSQSNEADSLVAYGTAIDVGVAYPPNVSLIYDDNDITVINLMDASLDVSDVIFTADDVTVTYRANQIADTVRAQECLQLWSITRGSAKDVSGCDTIQWRTTTNIDFHFWTQANRVNSFTVTNGDTQLAECLTAPLNSQDTPLTCEFYLAGDMNNADVSTPYIYLAYTEDAIAFFNDSTDQWMLTDQTIILNNNPALEVEREPFIFGDTNLLSDDFRIGLGDVTRLAPQQCIVYTLEGADTPEAPKDCHTVAQRALSPDVAFWTHPFGIQSSSDMRERTCPAALKSRLTLCILPR